MQLIKTCCAIIFLSVQFGCTAAENTAPLQRAPSDAPVYNVVAFGAVGDGETDNTRAINHAISTCAESGGGTVTIPAGRYVTGAIQLQNHVTLDLAAGCTLLGSQDFDDYPVIDGLWGGDPVRHYSSLINGDGLENIAVTGRGTIDARGKVWWDAHDKLRHPPGRLIGLYRCRNVRIEGLTLRNSPAWTVHTAYCEDVVIRDLTIRNPYDSVTSDGMDIDSSRDVRIANCDLAVGDDCITIKSGKDEYGRRIGIPSENITITNCVTGHGYGGVVIGSETSGGVRNVVISNCVFDGTDSGIRMKTQRGRGGVVENVRVSNVVMRNIGQMAIKLNMKYQELPAEPVSERTPTFRNIHFANITVDNAMEAGYLVGLPEMPLENVTISNSNFVAQKGFQCVDARDLAFHNVAVTTQRGPAIQCAQTTGLEISGFTNRRPHPEVPLIALDNVQRALIRNSRAPEGTDTFLQIAGPTSADILLLGNSLSRAKHPVTPTEGAPDDAWTIE